MFTGMNQRKANRQISYWESDKRPPTQDGEAAGRSLTIAGPCSHGAGMSRMCLECVEEKFPTQLVREPAREGTCWTCCL